MIAVDDREHEVYSNLLNFNISITKQRLSVGDFVIFHDDKPQLIVERKTWSDMAASIKDNRIVSQSEAMKDHRDQYDIKLAIILEGMPALPNEDKLIENIPAKSIYSKIRRLYLFHNIATFQSRDSFHTAEILVNFVNDYEIQDNKIGNGDSSYLSKNKGVRKKDESEVLFNIWTSFPGIGEKIAKVFMNNISIKQFISVGKDELEKIMRDNNLRCGKKTIDKIIEGRLSCPKKVLSQIPSIGDKKSNLILENITLEKLINLENLKDLKILNKKHIENITKYINLVLLPKLEEESKEPNLLDLTDDSKIKNIMVALLSKNTDAWKWLISILDKI